MNKPKFRKLLTLLVCMVFVASLCVLTACQKDNNSSSDDETITRTPSFTNGNFESIEDADETTYPYTPDNFTASPTADVSAIGTTLEDTVSGVISLSDYNSYKANWGDLAVIKKDTNYLDDDDDDETNYGDDNVLMIYNSKPSYFLYWSDAFTISASTTYKISVDVYTTALAGGDKKGATIKITGNDSTNAVEGYAQFDSVVSDQAWTTYTFYIVGKDSGTASLNLQLMLGNNIASDTGSAYLTQGYAFFDNIRMTTVDSVEANSAKVKTINLKTPNAQFDYTNTSNYPYLYSKASTDGNSSFGMLNLIDGIGGLTLGEYEVVNPGYATGDNDNHNAFIIYNTTDASMGFYTTNTNYLVRGGNYKITLAINTEFVTAGKAYFGVGTSSDNDDCTVLEYGQQAGWQIATIYVYVNENTSANMYIHFGLGKDTNNYAAGYAFFDVLNIETTDNTTETGEYVIDERISADDNLLKKNSLTFQTNDAWTIDSTSGITNTATAITNASYTDTTSLPYNSSAFAGNIKVSASAPTLYELGLVATLNPYSYYRFSIWIKTEDVQSTSGVYLTIYDGDLRTNANATAIATYNPVITEEDLADSTSSLNGYRELVCYFQTAKIDQNVTFVLSFGSGTQWTSSTLFDGTAYIVNYSLLKTEYSKYNSASSAGTYEQKYSWVATTSPSFTNGQFDNYDYSAIKGLENGGMVEGEFQKTVFGSPSSWTLSGDSSYVYAGIVDINNADLLSNLNTAGVDTANFNPVVYDPATIDVTKYGTYVGGDKFLMIYAPDATGLVKKTVKAGYASNSVTLSANTTYRISVLVKVLSGTASVYLTADNNLSETNDSSKFEITDTSSATITNGWKRYSFEVKVGFSSVTAKLNLYLGALENDVTLVDGNMEEDVDGAYVKDSTTGNYVAYDEDTHSGQQRYKYNEKAVGGCVLFDYVTMTTIDDEDATATADSDYEETNAVEMKVDGFGLSSTYSAGTYQTPTSWTKTLSSNTDTENNKYGVLVGGTDELKAHTGDNALAIKIPNTAGAIYYTMSSAKSLSQEKFYKISVWAKTINVAGGKAYAKLTVTDYDDQIIYFDNTTEWTQYTFFIKTPSANDDFGSNVADISAKLVLGLGETSSEYDALATGMVLFDDVLIEEVTDGTKTAQQQYDEFVEASSAYGKAYNYKSLDPEEETDPESEDDDDDDSDSKNYNWLIFTSVAFAALIVIVVVVYFLKKYLPKRKDTRDHKKTTKKKEDDYKDLKD